MESRGDELKRSGKPDLEPKNWYVLLTGVPRPSEDLRLGDGVTLRALPEPLSVFDLAAAGASGFREWAVLEPLAAVATCEIETAADATGRPGYNTLNRAWLAASMLVLRGYPALTAPACSAYSWSEIAGHTGRTSAARREQVVEARAEESQSALPTFIGGLLDYHLNIITNSHERRDSLTQEEARWIADHFDEFNRIAAESESFRFALQAAVDWRYTKEPRAALARLWSGIEALYGIKSELVYRISILSASLLEPRGEKRRSRYAEVKRLYDARSKAVHGDKLTNERLQEGIDGSFELLSALLLLAVERGHALSADDFDAALFD